MPASFDPTNYATWTRLGKQLADAKGTTLAGPQMLDNIDTLLGLNTSNMADEARRSYLHGQVNNQARYLRSTPSERQMLAKYGGGRNGEPFHLAPGVGAPLEAAVEGKTVTLPKSVLKDFQDEGMGFTTKPTVVSQDARTATVRLTADDADELFNHLDELSQLEAEDAVGRPAAAWARKGEGVNVRKAFGISESPKVSAPQPNAQEIEQNWKSAFQAADKNIQATAPKAAFDKAAYESGWKAGLRGNAKAVEKADISGAAKEWYAGFFQADSGGEKFGNLAEWGIKPPPAAPKAATQAATEAVTQAAAPGNLTWAEKVERLNQAANRGTMTQAEYNRLIDKMAQQHVEPAVANAATVTAAPAQPAPATPATVAEQAAAQTVASEAKAAEIKATSKRFRRPTREGSMLDRALKERGGSPDELFRNTTQSANPMATGNTQAAAREATKQIMGEQGNALPVPFTERNVIRPDAVYNPGELVGPLNQELVGPLNKMTPYSVLPAGDPIAVDLSMNRPGNILASGPTAEAAATTTGASRQSIADWLREEYARMWGGAVPGANDPMAAAAEAMIPGGSFGGGGSVPPGGGSVPPGGGIPGGGSIPPGEGGGEGWLRSLLNTGEGTVGRRLAAVEGQSLAELGLRGVGKLAWGVGEGLMAAQGVDWLGDYALHLINGGKPASRWENALKSAASFGVGGATMFGPEAALITAPIGAAYGYITGDDAGRARQATQQAVAQSDAQLSAYMDIQGVSAAGQKSVLDHMHAYVGKETDPAKIQAWYQQVSQPLADQTIKNESQTARMAVVQQYLLPLMQQNTSNAINYANAYGNMALQNARQVSDPSIRAALTAQANYYPARAAEQAASQQNQLVSALALGGANPQSVTDQYLNKILVTDQQNALKKQLAQQVTAGAAAGMPGSSVSADPLGIQYAPASQGGYAG